MWRMIQGKTGTQPPREAEASRDHSTDLESVLGKLLHMCARKDDHSTSTSNRDRDGTVTRASELTTQEAPIGQSGIVGQPETHS